MKNILILLFIICTVPANTFIASGRIMYVAAANGLSLRESGDITANTIAKIPYGTKVKVDSLVRKCTVDGFDTHWAALSYNGNTGYILDAYLLPVQPPKMGTKNLKEYADRLSALACKPVIHEELHPSDQNIRDEKHLYQNGFVYTVHDNYEYLSLSLIIPQITIQHAYLLLQNIEELKPFLPKDGIFPRKDSHQDLANGGFRNVNVTQVEYLESGYRSMERLIFSVDDMSLMGTVSLFELNGQVIIMYEYGV